MPNLWPSDKPLPSQSTSYRNFGILEKEDIDLELDDELSAVPGTDQKITVVDSHVIGEQDGISVAKIGQQILNDFWKSSASYSLSSELRRYYSAMQLMRQHLSGGIVVEFNTELHEVVVLHMVTVV